jgi:hypothetical protein
LAIDPESPLGLDQSEIGNWQWESPAPNNAGLSKNPIRLVSRERLAELFSGLFFVAASRLNSPRFFQELLKH